MADQEQHGEGPRGPSEEQRARARALAQARAAARAKEEAAEKPKVDRWAGLKQRISEAVAGVQLDPEVQDAAGFVVQREDLLRVVGALRELPDVRIDWLSDITGVDFPDRLVAVYTLWGRETGAKVMLKVPLDKEDPVVDSLTGFWAGANWMERETWDLLGIRFRNHPDLRRILTWEGYEGHPLRKDFVDRRPKRPRKVRIR